MKRIVTIFYRGQKIITGEVEGKSESQTQDQAFDFADAYLNLTDENDKMQVELCFHDERAALRIFNLESQYIAKRF